MSTSLEDRGRALEDEFFHKENQKKIEALRGKLDAQRTRDELRRTSGMTDDAVLDRLIGLGLNATTVSALSLVPLIWVAWADGTIQDAERDSILAGAHGKGLDNGSDGYAILESWLAKRPDEALYAAWTGYIKALTAELNDEQNRLLKNQVVSFAKVIASSSGGFLGIHKVSSGETDVLAKIEAAFDR